MALGAGSAALNGAVLADCPATDQRGVTRPQGTGCDIGAFELAVSDATGSGCRLHTGPGQPGDGAWYKTSVALKWSVSDPESIVTKTGCLDVTVSSDQAITQYSCSAESSGGTTGPVTVSFGYDATPPTLTSSVADNSAFVLGQAAPALTVSTATDLSPDGAAGPIVPSGINASTKQCGTIDTSSAGVKSTTCSVADNAGNETSTTVHYIVTHGFGGFQSPLPKSSQKTGSSIPVKFTVKSFGGTQTFTALTNLRVRIVEQTCPARGPLLQREHLGVPVQLEVASQEGCLHPRCGGVVPGTE